MNNIITECPICHQRLHIHDYLNSDILGRCTHYKVQKAKSSGLSYYTICDCLDNQLMNVASFCTKYIGSELLMYHIVVIIAQEKYVLYISYELNKTIVKNINEKVLISINEVFLPEDYNNAVDLATRLLKMRAFQ